PSNVLVNRQGYAKVLDFGLAKQMISKAEVSLVTTDVITGAADVMGTPAYMSPEQAFGKPVDARTDTFSLGVVLYEAVTGTRPFTGDSVIQVLNEVITKEPRSAVEIKPSLPGEVQWILERALAKDPKNRYASMADFATELRRLRAKIDASGSGRTGILPTYLRRNWMAGAAAFVVFAAVATSAYLWNARMKARSSAVRYQQLTDFNDAAFAPALSPDGRMLAFVRGGFFGSSAIRGEIYVKMLPDGEPIRLTSDGSGKHTPTFSPDGSRVLYTRLSKNFTWDTWQVPVLGGEATPYLPNASGLTFVGTDEIMFAEIKTSPHMRIMTSGLNRLRQREIYMPPGEGSMAHRAALSPDRKWVLLAEMDGSGWLPCRVVPFDGTSAGRQVGPLNGQCITASWSLDGKTMYFSSNAGGTFHIWQQTFPDGDPEQLTMETTEQEGTALAPDGKSLITSVGVSQSSIWIHDKEGDRQLTFQGFAFLPKMSPDGAMVYYLQRAGASRSYVSAELWRLDLKSGNREPVLPGFVMAAYDISPDGRRLVFASAEGTSHPGIWVADLDRRKPPVQLTKSGEYRAFLIANDEIVYLGSVPKRFLYTMKTDGSGLRQVNDTQLIYMINVSPDGEWAAVSRPATDEGSLIQLIALRKSMPPATICQDCPVGFGPGRLDSPVVSWSRDGESVMVPLRFFGMSRRTVVLPFDPKRPDFDGEARTEADYIALPGSKLINERDVFPGMHSREYLMSRRSSVSNLYRVTLPE
ncbi:MAG: protein kinase, partial [Terriglobales bacterium]